MPFSTSLTSMSDVLKNDTTVDSTPNDLLSNATPQSDHVHDEKIDLASLSSRWSVIPQVKTRSPIVNRLWLTRYLDKSNPHQSSSSISYIPIEKHMKGSFVEEILPFRTNPEFREEYINVYGTIRIGKVLEDLDALAGSIAYKHCDDDRSDTIPLIIVTASVDRIDMINRIPIDEDISLSGFVTCMAQFNVFYSICNSYCRRRNIIDGNFNQNGNNPSNRQF